MPSLSVNHNKHTKAIIGVSWSQEVHRCSHGCIFIIFFSWRTQLNDMTCHALKFSSWNSNSMNECYLHLSLHRKLYFLKRLRPRQNDCHFQVGAFKCIFLNEHVWISIKISLKFVPKDPFNNILALVQKMAWRRPSDKPLFEAVMV